MKLAMTVAATAVTLCLATGTASAQYPAVVPHRGHYHIVTTYAPPVIYSVPTYNPAIYSNTVYSAPYSFGGGYSSPGISIGLNFGTGFNHGYSGQGSHYTGHGGYSGHGGHYSGHGGHR